MLEYNISIYTRLSRLWWMHDLTQTAKQQFENKIINLEISTENHVMSQF